MIVQSWLRYSMVLMTVRQRNAIIKTRTNPASHCETVPDVAGFVSQLRTFEKIPCSPFSIITNYFSLQRARKACNPVTLKQTLRASIAQRNFNSGYLPASACSASQMLPTKHSRMHSRLPLLHSTRFPYCHIGLC